MSSSSRTRESVSRERLVGLALLLALLAWGLHDGRRAFIRAFFVEAPRELASVPTTPPLEAQHPVRVVLLDGLGHEPASALPQLGRLCARGRDLRVDTGFPTVSLPVQNVLWSGLTQDQSGLLYRIARRSEVDGRYLPRRVSDSLAVAESHVDIISSFGFTEALPADEAMVDATWRETGFSQRAGEALASARSLVFVHVLRIDEAGHAQGAQSAAYDQAASSADAWLESWVEAAPEARWLILADHGHLPTGGHAGRDAGIPLVRACAFGPGIEALPADGATLHLVDLSRLLFSWFDSEPAEPALGRPLDQAIAEYRPGEHLPAPAWPRWLGALLCLALGLGLTARRREGLGPWWFPAAWLGFVLVYGVPTLSMPPIYPPLGLDAAMGAAPGWIVLFAVLATTRAAPASVLRRQLALPISCALAALCLCWGTPPLAPIWTAHASVLMVWCAFACAACALYTFGSALRGRDAQS